MIPVLIKTTIGVKGDNTFALPITHEEYLSLQKGFNQTPRVIPDKFKNLNILTFGDPMLGEPKVLSTYIDETLIKNRWINKNNFFTSNRLTKEDTAYAVQTDIDPRKFLKEIAIFHGQNHILIYIEYKKIKEITYDYTKTIRLVREGYTNQY